MHASARKRSQTTIDARATMSPDGDRRDASLPPTHAADEMPQLPAFQTRAVASSHFLTSAALSLAPRSWALGRCTRTAVHRPGPPGPRSQAADHVLALISTSSMNVDTDFAGDARSEILTVGTSPVTLLSNSDLGRLIAAYRTWTCPSHPAATRPASRGKSSLVSPRTASLCMAQSCDRRPFPPTITSDTCAANAERVVLSANGRLLYWAQHIRLGLL